MLLKRQRDLRPNLHPCFLWHIFVTVCSCHVTYAFQSESTLYSCLNVKELLARSRREIWRLSHCNWTLTSLARWLSVCLRTKWFWVRVKLQSFILLLILREKSLVCITFCGAFTSSHEVMKLHRIEFDVSGIMPTNAQNVSLIFFFNFMKKQHSTKCYGVFNHFSGTYEITKL